MCKPTSDMFYRHFSVFSPQVREAALEAERERIEAARKKKAEEAFARAKAREEAEMAAAREEARRAAAAAELQEAVTAMRLSEEKEAKAIYHKIMVEEKMVERWEMARIKAAQMQLDLAKFRRKVEDNDRVVKTAISPQAAMAAARAGETLKEELLQLENEADVQAACAFEEKLLVRECRVS